jgi:hypothetical protein
MRADAGTGLGRASLVLTGWYVALTLGLATFWSLLPSTNFDGRCAGISFGCAPAPQTTALLLGVAIGLPALAVSVVVSSVMLIVLLAGPSIQSSAAVGTLAAFSGWTSAGLILTVLAVTLGFA